MNFASRIVDAATRLPDQVAVERVASDGIRSTTYSSLIQHAGRWASRLKRLGVAPDDRVAILGDNDEPWIAAYLGILGIGAVAVPLDTAYRADQVRTVLTHSGARVLCVSERRRTALALDAAAPVLDVQLVTLEPLADSGVDASVRLAPIDRSPSDAAVMLFTSGTTADPKGVVLTHANLEAERVAALAVVDCHDRDVILGVLPLFHALAQMANLLVPFSVGARVVFLETVSSTTLVNALQERGITIFVCVPQFFYLIHQRVMNEVSHGGFLKRVVFRSLLRTNGWLRERVGWNPGRRWFSRVHRVLGPRMRLLITGGSRFDPAIRRDLYEMGFELLNGYGLTETSGAATLTRRGDRFTTSVGQPLAGVEVRIDDPRARTARGEGVPASERASRGAGVPGDPKEDGEILIRGPIVMREYFGRPDATAEAIRDGWLRTGDLGYIDDAGRVYITGRSKEVIVLSSGKNIYPEEIEAQYQRSPFVKELCVMGLARPGEPSSERLHAVVVPDEHALRERGAANVRELIRYELEGQSVQLPPHKRILSYDIWLTALPRTTTGKLRRHEIQRLVRERAEQTSGVGERALNDSEREWLEDPRHAAAAGVVAAALQRESVSPDANLELDLGLDSMERVELLTTLEQRAGVKVPTEARATIFTVRQLVDAVEKLRGTDDGSAGVEVAATPWGVLLSQAPDAALVHDLDWASGFRATLFLIIVRLFWLIARVLFGYRTSGAQHIPRTGPVIVCPNHQSYLDGLFVVAALPFHALRRMFFVGAAEYYQTPTRRRLARFANIVPVDADANLVAAMQQSASGLRSNHLLMLFPEGERTIDGEIRPFRKGAAILAANLAVPVVPVALDGPYSLWPRGRPFNWRGLVPGRTRVSLVFGPPLTIPPGAYADGAAAVQQVVAHLLSDVRHNAAPAHK